MPYDKNMPMRQGGDKFADVKTCLNEIVTDFNTWDAWHSTAEMCAVKLNHRGLGRFHKEMANRAHKIGNHFRKYITNKPFSISTQPNFEMAHKAVDSAHYSEEKTIWHLDKWCEMLNESRELFTDAACYLLECGELTLKGKISKYLKLIENECWAVSVVKDRITPTSMNHPDSYSVFEKLHCYFKKCYHGWKIDFDI